tara:strand:+ start:34 stop:423 length:390 start_codon:yes stop_codon:yes gene_type:complete
MKSNIEKVYSRLPKTELAKVELGLVDDLKGLLKAAEILKKNSKKNISEASTINDMAVRLLQQQEKIDNKSIELEKKAATLWKQYQKAANELGINPKNTPSFKIYEDVLEQLLLTSREVDVKSVVTMRLK